MFDERSRPKHIGIIMDGNGRWAKFRSRPRTYGHIKGARVAKRIITESVKKEIPALTLFAFSTENWSRPRNEVNFLMALLGRHLTKEAMTLHRQNIKFKALGDIESLPPEVISVIRNVEALTARNTGLRLQFAVNYGGRQEILEAVKRIVSSVAAGELNPKQIDEQVLAQSLYLPELPELDLIIRTSGESRISNFMLWQAAYAELYFTDVLWPEFSEVDFNLALQSFFSRQRRFGRISDSDEKPLSI